MVPYRGGFGQFIVLLDLVGVHVGDLGTGLPVIPHPFQGRVVLQTFLSKGTPIEQKKNPVTNHNMIR